MKASHGYASGGGTRRGSVVVIVVALLALLAVIGTVYIVSSRTERSSAASAATGVNLEWAESSVNDAVREAISQPLYDAQGVLGGNAHEGAFGVQKARNWTMPEAGVTNGLGSSNDDVHRPDDMWLAANLYRDGYRVDGRYNDFSVLSVNGFNPRRGEFDASMPLIDALGQPTMGKLKVVAGDETVRLEDGVVELLPFSDASGVRYRFGVRIIDANRMANLHVGTASASMLAKDAYGTYLTSYALGHRFIFDARDELANLDAYWRKGNFREDLGDELELRSYGSLGTPLIPGVVNLGGQPVWPYTLSNYDPDDGKLVGNARRGLYTTYSYSRELRPYMIDTDQFPQKLGARSAYTLTVPGWMASVVWPAYPRRVNANPPMEGDDFAAANAEAAAATNIATAMEKIAGYSHEEACAFAANYVSFRWNSWFTKMVTYKGQQIPAYYLFDCMPFVDDQGICITHSRSSEGDRPPPYALGGPGTPDLRAEPGRVYLGYSAQPFINEIAVRQTVAGQTSGDDDAAVELYNPYDVALSL